MPFKHLAALAVVCSLLPGLHAHGQAPARATLATATKISCRFTLLMKGAWTGAQPRGEVKAVDLSVRFAAIDTDAGTAQITGNFGPSDIIVKLTQGNLHFLQVFRDGPVYMTTVFESESRPGKLKAVHTRHEYAEVSLPGFTDKPELYYGECGVDETRSR